MRSSNATTGNKRIPVHAQRGKLGVTLKPDLRDKFVERWVQDSSEGGTRITKFLNGGYTMVLPEEVESIGEDLLFESQKEKQTVIRRVANQKLADGKFLYLMKIKREWYEEDQKAKHAEVDLIEQEIVNQSSTGGNKVSGTETYGEVNIQKRNN